MTLTLTLPPKSDSNSGQGNVDTPSKRKLLKSDPPKPESSSKRVESNTSLAKRPKLSSAGTELKSSPIDIEDEKVLHFYCITCSVLDIPDLRFRDFPLFSFVLILETNLRNWTKQNIQLSSHPKFVQIKVPNQKNKYLLVFTRQEVTNTLIVKIIETLTLNCWSTESRLKIKVLKLCYITKSSWSAIFARYDRVNMSTKMRN